MGKSKKLATLMRGLAAVMAVLLVLSLVGAGVVEGYRSALDGMFSTTSYVTVNDEDAARFKSDYATIEDMAAALAICLGLLAWFKYFRFLDDGIRVYFSYTPRNRSSLAPESSPDARARLHRWLCQSLCVPVISQLEDYLLSGVYFWQIDSHASTEGAAIRTAQLIEDLAAQGLG